jgi:hypothetical protein
LLNIFLRDALYTGYLSDYYGLSSTEQFFEVPLDSISGKAIRKCRSGARLPRWPGVKHLDYQTSAQYQSAIRSEAKVRGIAPVHLDTFWWGARDFRRSATSSASRAKKR